MRQTLKEQIANYINGLAGLLLKQVGECSLDHKFLRSRICTLTLGLSLQIRLCQLTQSAAKTGLHCSPFSVATAASGRSFPRWACCVATEVEVSLFVLESSGVTTREKGALLLCYEHSL